MPGEFGEVVNNGFGEPNVGTEEVYDSYWKNGDAFGDWTRGIDTYGHNEALAAYSREVAAAQNQAKLEYELNAKGAAENRNWEKMMSDTAFQRKVADYVSAGFSPLAALEGSVGASSPSGSAASVSASKPSANLGTKHGNGVGGVIGSIVGALALIATKGMSAMSKAAESSGKAAQEAARLASNEKIASLRIASNEKIHSDFWARKIADEQEKQISRKYMERLKDKMIEDVIWRQQRK